MVTMSHYLDGTRRSIFGQHHPGSLVPKPVHEEAHPRARRDADHFSERLLADFRQHRLGLPGEMRTAGGEPTGR